MLAYTTKDNKDAVITVGIIQKDKMTYGVYGENGIILSPEEHTNEIGSITKTFTTALLCKAISEGRINLDDTIDMYLNIPKKDAIDVGWMIDNENNLFNLRHNLSHM